MYGMYLDIDGRPVKRTPVQYPYSYDLFVQYKNGGKSEITQSAYSDRLFQWDFKKYNDLCIKNFGNEGQYFDERKPNDIEMFLSDYFEKKIKLIVIMKGCNVSSGFAVWYFGFRDA